MNDKTYFDIAGRPVTLDELVRREPEWAAARIRHMEQQLDRQQEAGRDDSQSDRTSHPRR